MSARPLRLWQVALIGPGLIAYGIYEWWDLYKFEATGGTKHVGRMTYVLYDLGGKNLVAAVTAGIGLLTVWLLVRFLRQEREAHEKLAELDEREARRDQPDEVDHVDDRADDVATHPATPPKGTPPRLGDLPFRSPPVNVVVVPTVAAQPDRAPVIAGDPDDKPKLLT